MVLLVVAICISLATGNLERSGHSDGESCQFKWNSSVLITLITKTGRIAKYQQRKTTTLTTSDYHRITSQTRPRVRVPK